MSGGGAPETNDMLLKSQVSTTPVYLRLINQTNYMVDIWWRNFNCELVLYGRLPPNGFLDVNTFTGHYWSCCNTFTRERYTIGGLINFKAEPKIIVVNNREMQLRTKWSIQSCVRSLESEAALRIATMLPHVQHVHDLGLPRQITEQLDRLCKLIFFQKNTLVTTGKGHKVKSNYFYDIFP